MKYVKLDVSKSHISLIFINTFSCWCCKWSLLTLLANIKWGMIIIATTSLGLDLLESWSWESLHFLLEFTLHIHKIGCKLFSSMDTNSRLLWDPCAAELCRVEVGQPPSVTSSPSPGRRVRPRSWMSCTRGTPRRLLGGNASFPAPSFSFIRSKPQQEEAHILTWPLWPLWNCNTGQNKFFQSSVWAKGNIWILL